MKPEEIKKNLNKLVRYKSTKLGLDSECILTGAIFRKGENGFYYQAELTDPKWQNSLIIAGLEQIEAIKEGG